MQKVEERGIVEYSQVKIDWLITNSKICTLLLLQLKVNKQQVDKVLFLLNT